MSNLTFDEGQERVNVRCAGIILHQNHVLVVREDDEDYVCLPGGRVQRGESSLDAIHREMDEELNAQIEAPQLRYMLENFFWRDGMRFHEFAFYYEVAKPDHVPFQTGVCITGEDDGKELCFEWVKTTPDALAEINLHPFSLRSRLATMPEGFLHETIVDPDY